MHFILFAYHKQDLFSILLMTKILQIDGQHAELRHETKKLQQLSKRDMQKLFTGYQLLIISKAQSSTAPV